MVKNKNMRSINCEKRCLVHSHTFSNKYWENTISIAKSNISWEGLEWNYLHKSIVTQALYQCTNSTMNY